MKLGQEFDPRNNALNAWRLTLAMGVILSHSFGLTGHGLTGYQLVDEPLHQLLRDVWVDGFFAISGFLIVSSWFNNPRPRAYFVARGLRILPGLWICLIVTAFVIAPIGVAIQGGSAAKLLLSTAPVEYVLKNSAVLMTQFDIGGTPNGIPWPLQWNGSLWTLIWEVLCYIGVAVLGVVGLLRRRWVVPVALGSALLWSALIPSWVLSVIEAPAGTQEHIDAANDPETIALLMQAIAARFAVMFLAGALLYQFRHVIPARWSLVGASVVIVLGASLLPNYRLLAAIPLAYAIIVSGALIHNERFRLRTDLSYGVYIYAFPVQQLLILGGLARLNTFLFAAVAALATLPLAALSWFLIEKPSLSLKSRLRGRGTAQPATSPPGQTDSGESAMPDVAESQK
jgi:peptidoglycan/LPS O-acetylase OafA/YrhL